MASQSRQWPIQPIFVADRYRDISRIVTIGTKRPLGRPFDRLSIPRWPNQCVGLGEQPIKWRGDRSLDFQDVGVDHRRLQTAVPEQRLDAADVSTVGQQMRGE